MLNRDQLESVVALEKGRSTALSAVHKLLDSGVESRSRGYWTTIRKGYEAYWQDPIAYGFTELTKRGIVTQEEGGTVSVNPEFGSTLELADLLLATRK